MNKDCAHPLRGLLDLYLTLPTERFFEWLREIDDLPRWKRNAVLETFNANKERRDRIRVDQLVSLKRCETDKQILMTVNGLLSDYWNWRDGANGGMIWRLLPPPWQGQTEFSYRAEHDTVLSPFVKQMLLIQMGSRPGWWVHVVELNTDHWRDLMVRDLLDFDADWAEVIRRTWSHWVLLFCDYLFEHQPLSIRCANDAFISMHNFLFVNRETV